MGSSGSDRHGRRSSHQAVDRVESGCPAVTIDSSATILTFDAGSTSSIGFRSIRIEAMSSSRRIDGSRRSIDFASSTTDRIFRPDRNRRLHRPLRVASSGSSMTPSRCDRIAELRARRETIARVRRERARKGLRQRDAIHARHRSHFDRAVGGRDRLAGRTATRRPWPPRRILIRRAASGAAVRDFRRDVWR